MSNTFFQVGFYPSYGSDHSVFFEYSDQTAVLVTWLNKAHCWSFSVWKIIFLQDNQWPSNTGKIRKLFPHLEKQRRVFSSCNIRDMSCFVKLSYFFWNWSTHKWKIKNSSERLLSPSF